MRFICFLGTYDLPPLIIELILRIHSTMQADCYFHSYQAAKHSSTKISLTLTCLFSKQWLCSSKPYSHSLDLLLAVNIIYQYMHAPTIAHHLMEKWKNIFSKSLRYFTHWHFYFFSQSSPFIQLCRCRLSWVQTSPTFYHQLFQLNISIHEKLSFT